MNDIDVKGAFWRLFQGRRFAYGTEQGGCVRLAPNWNEGDWINLIGRHLDGSADPIGIYPIDPRDRHQYLAVHWGCVDIDVRNDTHATGYASEEEAHIVARNLRAVLARFNLTGWIERTRSGGRHVWVFADDWVPARMMRHALLAACRLADAPPREVNPKQDVLADGQLGNYVRLPYPNGLDSEYLGSRFVYDNPDDAPLTVEQFVASAFPTRGETEDFIRLADLYAEPKVALPTYRFTPWKSDGLALPPYIVTMINGGPLDGQDRSSFLCRVAAKCRDNGIEPSVAMQAVELADEVCGKYVHRADRDKRLAEIVEKVYG